PRRVHALCKQDVEDWGVVGRPIHQRFAGPDPFALLNVDVHATRECVFTRLGTRLVRSDDDLPLAFDDAAVLDEAVDLGNDRGLTRLPRLEQLDHARQTTGDVLGFRGLARHL